MLNGLRKAKSRHVIFFCLEQTCAASNSFNSLFDENGVEKNSQDLENILTRFYQTLFMRDSLDMQIQMDIIDALEFSLTEYERQMCEGIFTSDELLATLKGLQPVKRPVLMAFLQNFILLLTVLTSISLKPIPRCAMCTSTIFLWKFQMMTVRHCVHTVGSCLSMIVFIAKPVFGLALVSLKCMLMMTSRRVFVS